MERLYPEPGPTTIAEQMAVFDPRGDAPGERPRVYSNFAMTLDGRATIDGVSGEIGSDTDTEMLMALRQSADAVLVGAGTLRQERYGRLVPSAERRAARESAGHPPDPLAVTVSSGLDLPWDADLFTCGAGRVVICTDGEEEPPATETPVEIVRLSQGVDLAVLLGRLRADFGVAALLCEGGPHLHHQLAEQGLLDELFLTIGPSLAGGDSPSIVEGDALGPRGLELRWLLREGSELFARYATRS